MSGASIKIALLATLMIIALISASSSPAWADKKSPPSEPNPANWPQCSSTWSNCRDQCDNYQPKTEGSLYSQCVGQCDLAYLSCLSPATSGSRNGQPTNPPNAPPPNAPPKGITGLPPVNVGGNKQPVGGGGTLPPKGPIGVPPVSPVNPVQPVEVNQPGTGTTGTGSGETIYAKGGTVKLPVITTSPIGVTTTTVYDANGNSTSTNTDPTGKILSKTTTMLGQAGASMSTTTDANGKILSTTVKTPDSKGDYIAVTRDKNGKVLSSTLYDNTGKIVSQSAKIMTSTTGTGDSYSTGKGDKRVFHEDKHNLNRSWKS
ncbi:MAG: hypothetical protein ACLQPD_20245 [Desulfomonilaceae bacterium]